MLEFKLEKLPYSRNPFFELQVQFNASTCFDNRWLLYLFKILEPMLKAYSDATVVIGILTWKLFDLIELIEMMLFTNEYAYTLEKGKSHSWNNIKRKSCIIFLSYSLTLLPKLEHLSSHNNIQMFPTSSLGLKLPQMQG